MTTTVKARFDGRVFVPNEPVDLPTDHEVVLRIEETVSQPDLKPSCSLAELAKQLNQLPYDADAPTDAAAQHDHYLYGTPKRDDP